MIYFGIFYFFTVLFYLNNIYFLIITQKNCLNLFQFNAFNFFIKKKTNY